MVARLYLRRAATAAGRKAEQAWAIPEAARAAGAD